MVNFKLWGRLSLTKDEWFGSIIINVKDTKCMDNLVPEEKISLILSWVGKKWATV